MGTGGRSTDLLTDAEQEYLATLRNAASLADLRAVTGEADDHDAYVAAKRDWRRLRGKELGVDLSSEGLPGNRVTVGDTTYHVHGITHADTAPEGSFVREHVRRFLAEGASVYVEQGIRPMYFSDLDGVCEMDDYRWAMARCRDLGVATELDGMPNFDSFGEQLDSLAGQFRNAVFSLVDAGPDGNGKWFRRTLGDVASTFLTSHESMATGEDFASFVLARRAAENPERLGALQRYYETAFLPQPVEREWLRRHDPELEIVTHARNERQADYAVYHGEDASAVHVVVGAAHQPGVTYYLERHRDGHRSAADYEPVP